MSEVENTPEETTPATPAAGARKKRTVTKEQLEALVRGRAAKAKKKEERLRELAEKHSDAPASPLHEDVPPAPRDTRQFTIETFQEDVPPEPDAYTPDADVPPDEENPHRRSIPTMEVEVPDLSGDHYVPRNLDDLMGLAPIGDGQYYISVERKAPRVWSGAQCSGILPHLTKYLSTDEFKRSYGGGEYVLVLYGPPKRGGVYDPETRRVRPKALTTPVRFTVPLHEYAPQLFDDLGDEEDAEEEMRYTNVTQPWAAGRPKSTAEARMFEASLEHEERQEARKEQRERERTERDRQLQEEAQQQGLTMAELLARQKESEIRRIELAHQREMEIAERSHKERLEMMRAEVNKPGETQALGSALKDILQVMKPDGASEKQINSLAAQHAKDIERMQEQVKEASERADRRVTEAEQRADRAKEDADRRADERVKDIERRSEDRIKEAHERAEKRIREVEEAARRIVDDARQQAQQRLDDERRNHDRDLRAKEDAGNMRVESLKSSYETRLAAKDEEITRQRAEVERWRQEALQKGDLAKQVQVFASTAEALGFSKDTAAPAAEEQQPMDWKTMAMSIGAELIKNGPAMIQSAGHAVQQLRGQAPQPSAMAPYVAPSQHPQRQLPPRLHGRNGAVFQAAPAPAFGTEDGATFIGEPTHVAPKYPPGYMPSPPAQQQAASQVMMPPQQAQQQTMNPPPAQPSVPPQAPSQEAPGAGMVSPEQMMQFRVMLEAALAQNKNPAELAEEIKSSVGPQMAMAIAASVTPEAVVAALQQMPDGAQSPLIRREGQKFLRELHQALQG